MDKKKSARQTDELVDGLFIEQRSQEGMSYARLRKLLIIVLGGEERASKRARCAQAHELLNGNSLAKRRPASALAELVLPHSRRKLTLARLSFSSCSTSCSRCSEAGERASSGRTSSAAFGPSVCVCALELKRERIEKDKKKETHVVVGSDRQDFDLHQRNCGHLKVTLVLGEGRNSRGCQAAIAAAAVAMK